ncbi:MAG: hypothetical protein MK008_10330 [Bdellovibrionales bacterium]|nr:hypothetical protein [Bdellovibrionales bacterium]
MSKILLILVSLLMSKSIYAEELKYNWDAEIQYKFGKDEDITYKIKYGNTEIKKMKKLYKKEYSFSKFLTDKIKHKNMGVECFSKKLINSSTPFGRREFVTLYCVKDDVMFDMATVMCDMNQKDNAKSGTISKNYESNQIRHEELKFYLSCEI